jgi:hypothetical protein
MPAQFTIQGIETAQEPLLGIWQPSPAPPAPVSFGIEAPAEDGELLWSISLPANALQAHASLDQEAERIDSAQRAVAQAGKALQDLPPSWLEGTSFAFAPSVEAPSPEITLRRNLAQMREEEAEISYALGLPDAWSKTVAEYKDFATQTLHLLRPTLRVETDLDGKPLARTRVGLSGDFDTAWRSPHSPDQASLHQRSLSLTLESRLTLLQLMAQTGAGAAALVAKFSLPGGAVMALPAAWRFIQDVIGQAQKLVDLQRQLKVSR